MALVRYGRHALLPNAQHLLIVRVSMHRCTCHAMMAPYLSGIPPRPHGSGMLAVRPL